MQIESNINHKLNCSFARKCYWNASIVCLVK